ncbi:MAG TPA: cob(I)yrinic acid a,c-diamide adenosyltransferase [Anaerolineae bacterium]|nr:cob(I)yrinic acid a,c-diamide adenosyltransferase [Anaerolineae bacterium]
MKQGLVIVNTGNGKGKTTAMLGTIFRAWGRQMRICVIQFIKAETGNWGEVRAARKLGIEWHSSGDGFTWTSKDLVETGNKARNAWTLAQEKIASGQYDLIALDEITYAFNYGWLDITECVEWLREHKPPELHLILTGRDAPPELVEYADLVTEMREIKHPYTRGILAQAGVDF